MAATCTNCGAALEPGDRFCARCGTKVGTSEETDEQKASLYCTNCGNPLDPDDVFCGRCGSAVKGGVGEATGDETQAMTAADIDDDWFEGQDAVASLEAAAEEARSSDLAAGQETAALTGPDEQPTEVIAPTGSTEVIPTVQEGPQEPPEPAEPMEPPRRRAGFPVGATLALFASLAVVLSGLLVWVEAPRLGSLTGQDIFLRQLLRPELQPGGPSLAVGLLLVGTAGAVAAVITMAVPFLKPLRRIMGLLALAVPVFVAIRVAQGLGADFGQLFSVLGVGFYVAAAGGIVQVVAGKWFSR